MLIDARTVTAAPPTPLVVASATSDDLNVNLLAVPAGQGIPAHVNDEVDVLLVVLAGTATIDVDEQELRLGAGQALLLPKGTRRAIRATGTDLTYLTCHRRRPGLQPRPNLPARPNPAPTPPPPPSVPTSTADAGDPSAMERGQAGGRTFPVRPSSEPADDRAAASS